VKLAIKWLDTDKVEELERPDALRMVRRGRALLAKVGEPKPAPKPKPAKDAERC